MSRGTAFAKIAAMAQMLDDLGLHGDADVMDELLEAAAQPGILKEAGVWRNILSRLSGWARKALFREYRTMYDAAMKTQEALNGKLDELNSANKELKGTLARHELSDWRNGASKMVAALAGEEKDVLSDYDEQRAKMVARLLKLSPGGAKPGSALPALLPEEEEHGKRLERSLGEVPDSSSEEPVPLTKVKKKPAPEPEPELEPEPVKPVLPATAPAPKPPVEPKIGWRKERFGTSGKHGWEWEWEVSPEGDKLRLPKSSLAAAASGKGKILHHSKGLYRPTGGTSSMKLRRIMGDTFWKEESDPSDPNMAILVRTDEVVPPPLSLRPEPAGQARKLKDLGKSSAMRRSLLAAFAAEAFGDEAAAEKMLEEAAEELLGEHGEDEQV
jgi:hypothetical protein